MEMFSPSLRSIRTSRLCHSCLGRYRSVQVRNASVTVSQSSQQGGHTIPKPSSPVTTSTTAAFPYTLRAAILLSRPPLLTRELTPFEKSFFFYQKRLNEQLALPFNSYFYFPRGGPAELEWTRRVRKRETPSRDIGTFKGLGIRAWNDELLSGDVMSEPEMQVKAIVRDARYKGKRRTSEAGVPVAKDSGSNSEKQTSDGSKSDGAKKDLEIVGPLPRETEADKTNDLRSLNRKLDRTLYLVVKQKSKNRKWDGDWNFPGRDLQKKETFRAAAEKIIPQTGGVNMNTWLVGNMPICHQVFKYPQAILAQTTGQDQTFALDGEKTFYMKARIMAGRANLAANELDLEDYKWLSREELKEVLLDREFASVEKVLAER